MLTDEQVVDVAVVAVKRFLRAGLTTRAASVLRGCATLLELGPDEHADEQEAA